MNYFEMQYFSRMSLYRHHYEDKWSKLSFLLKTLVKQSSQDFRELKYLGNSNGLLDIKAGNTV